MSNESWYERALEKQKPLIRWVIFLPVSLIAALFITVIINIGYSIVISYIMWIDPMIIRQCLSAFIFTAAFIFICIQIVPSHKYNVAIILNIIITVLTAVLVVWSTIANFGLGRPVWDFIWSEVAMLCGIGGGWYGYNTQRAEIKEDKTGWEEVEDA